MKKVTAILFLLVIMLSTMHIAEFFKINTFISHYIEHKSEDSKMSLWQFITIHYMSGDVQDEDYKEDMKLPFKDLANHGNINITLDQPGTPISIKPATELTSRKFLIQNLTIPSANFTNSIWQPPRA